MAFLDYTIISTTSNKNYLYIHDEKQIYWKQRNTKDGMYYKCKVQNCDCWLVKNKLNCYRSNPLVEHNHTEDGESEFDIHRNRALLIKDIKDKLLIRDITPSMVKHEIEEKFGKLNKSTLRNLINDVKGQSKKMTGTIITVQSVNIIPKEKIIPKKC